MTSSVQTEKAHVVNQSFYLSLRSENRSPPLVDHMGFFMGEKKTYVIGKGFKKSHKEMAEVIRKKESSEAKKIMDENRMEKAMRTLRAQNFLQKSFKWHKTPNTPSKDFYKSDAWAKVRYAALINFDGRCVCCGASSADGVCMHVDHIKPRSKFPELALELSNLQVLCELCNRAKSNVDDTDWRKDPLHCYTDNFDEYSDAKIAALLKTF